MEPSFSNLKPKKQVKNKTENRIRVECPNGTVPILKNTKKYVANAQYWAERHFNPLTDESPGKHPNITAPATIAKPKNSLQDRVAQVYGGGLVHMVHSTVRRKWLDGDEFIISSMAEIAKLAEDGRTALLKRDYTKELMNRNFDLRRSMFGDECLGAMNIEMVEVAVWHVRSAQLQSSREAEELWLLSAPMSHLRSNFSKKNVRKLDSLLSQ
ncbi:unnamed protein product [Brassica rapa subsp. narinosa]